MKTKYKKKAIPKHFWGALLSTGVGLATSAITANQAKKQQQKAQNIAKQNTYKEELYNDNIEAQQYQDNISQNNVQGFYQAKGGKLATPPSSLTKGGKLKPLSSDMVLAKGNKHEESKIDNTSGIKLLKNGKAFAEIEDDETIKNGRMVYSDRLTVDGKNTYADIAKKLAKEKSKIETNQFKGDVITNNTNKRKLAIIDKKENNLFLQQEQSKVNVPQTNNIPKAAFGDFLKTTLGKGSAVGDFISGTSKAGKVANNIGKNITPFIDNIGNAIITNKTPKIAAPNLERVKSLKTNVNVNPQLNSINEGVNSATTAIQNNTSNSNTARENIASTKLRGATAKANILANKENTETQLQNRNLDRIQATQAKNNAKVDNYNMQQTLRADDIGKRTSANLANLAGDFIDKRNFDAIKGYQDKQLDIISKSGDKGVTGRVLESTGYKQPTQKVASTFQNNNKTFAKLNTTSKLDSNIIQPTVKKITPNTPNEVVNNASNEVVNSTPQLKLNSKLQLHKANKKIVSANNPKSIQQSLMNLGYLGQGEDDGIIGNKSKSAIMKFQKENGLKVDGIVGKNTLAKLNSY